MTGWEYLTSGSMTTTDYMVLHFLVGLVSIMLYNIIWVDDLYEGKGTQTELADIAAKYFAEIAAEYAVIMIFWPILLPLCLVLLVLFVSVMICMGMYIKFKKLFVELKRLIEP